MHIAVTLVPYRNYGGLFRGDGETAEFCPHAKMVVPAPEVARKYLPKGALDEKLPLWCDEQDSQACSLNPNCRQPPFVLVRSPEKARTSEMPDRRPRRRGYQNRKQGSLLKLAERAHSSISKEWTSRLMLKDLTRLPRSCMVSRGWVAT